MLGLHLQLLENPVITSGNNGSQRGISKIKVKQKDIRSLPSCYWCRRSMRSTQPLTPYGKTVNYPLDVILTLV